MAKRRPQSSGNDPVYAVFDAVIAGIGWLIRLPFRNKQAEAELQKAKAQFATHFTQIDVAMASGQTRDAIMSADILLDKALQLKKVQGNTLGERLKSVGTRLKTDTLNRAWNAHKIRNRLAHELQYSPTAAEAKQAISDFKATVRELGLL